MCRSGRSGESGSSTVVQGEREVLPSNVVPRHYELTFEPNFNTFTFDGSCSIDLDVVEDSHTISLNTLKLELKSTTISFNGTVIADGPRTSYDETKQITHIEVGRNVPAGAKIKLHHTFAGILNDDMAGFYRSSYTGEDGKPAYIAGTQMEATDARQAFPCFDEPALKATFTITLIADEDMTCLSNMDVDSETTASSTMTKGKRKAVKFNKTPVMSTYLVAFIVGKLKCVSTDNFRVPIKTWMTPDQNLEHGQFSVDLAAKVLAFYEKSFDIEYPLPKMDMVAVPDFSSGAMENWGLVTYRVVDVLLDEKTSSTASKERVAEVVQHELAHQWFGNLVTMDFWDGLWLNEGFATWMSWYSCNTFYPEWKVWQTYVIDSLQSALSLDSLRSSHPVEVPVRRVDELNQIFDAISYSKGSSVLRMISRWLGEDTFLEGVRRYLKKHAYGNTKTSDLWASLSEASGKNVSDVMETWTKKVGFPVVSVTEKPETGSIEVKQNRFLRTGDVKPEDDKTLFPVALGLKTSKGVQHDLMLTKRKMEVKVPDMDFFKLNADSDGLYRVAYSPYRWGKLGQAAKDGLLSVEDRAGMIADAASLSASGYSKTSGTLSLLKSFDSETEYVVWAELLERIGAVRAAWMFEDEAIKDALEAFQLNLSSAKAHELGWEFPASDNHTLAQLKAILFGSAGLCGDQEIVAAAQSMFSKYTAGDADAIHPNIRASVFAIAVQHGGENEWNTVWDRYKNAPTADEKNTALRALGRSKRPELIQKTLSLLDDGEVKNQDLYLPLSGLRVHAPGIQAKFDYMCSKWPEIVKKLPPYGNMLAAIVTSCTSGFTTEKQAGQIEAFFKTVDNKVSNFSPLSSTLKLTLGLGLRHDRRKSHRKRPGEGKLGEAGSGRRPSLAQA